MAKNMTPAARPSRPSNEGVSRARHGRASGEAQLAGGAPWQHDTVVQRGVRHAPPTDNIHPADIPGDCPGD